MGGYGSGPNCCSKQTVESCRCIDVNRWIREGIIAEGIIRRGGWVWRDAYTEEQTASIGYEVNTIHYSDPWVRLFYTFSESKREVDYRIHLQRMPVHFGGIRWWFTCPLVVGGRSCNRRVGKLYLPPGGIYYGCRHCYNLTYTSCQESRKYDSLFRKLAISAGTTPDIVKRVFSNDW